MTKNAVIYSRISVTQEASVSLERQQESARMYAAARGFNVVGSFVDDGVSATANRPDQRPGWKAMLASPLKFQVVIALKVDRVARRTIDFLQAHEQLQARGAALVCVDDPIDMSTAQGRGFATMLAVFAEMEAAAIADRVRGARKTLLHSGRVAGGKVPWGWRSVRNPDGGPGYVLQQDPDAIEHVRLAVERTQAGHSIYSTQQLLAEQGVKVGYTSLERTIRNPLVAGLIAWTPGNKGKARGDGLVRDANGLPVRYPELAVTTESAWRSMLSALDAPTTGRRTPRALRAATSGAWSGLVWCADARHDEPVRMHRGTFEGRHGYTCPSCHQTLTSWEDEAVAEFLRVAGDELALNRVRVVTTGGNEQVAAIEARIRELTAEMATTHDKAALKALREEQDRLLDLREEAEDLPEEVEYVSEPVGTFTEAWSAAASDEDRRRVLGLAIHRVLVHRGKPGRRTPGAVLQRLQLEWVGTFGEAH